MAFPVDPKNPYINDGLYKTTQSTKSIVEKYLNLSLTSTFAVDLKVGPLIEKMNKKMGTSYEKSFAEIISFLAYEAVIPGSSVETGQIFGDRQGVTETYITRRIYPPVDVSFYIQNDYRVLEFFEDWVTFASSQNLSTTSKPTSSRLNYPDDYKCDVNIVKFERDLRPKTQRLTVRGTEGGINDPRTYTHTLLNAYPANIISLPVSYEQTSVLRTTITFNYDRYFKQTNKGVQYNPPNV